MRSSSCSSALSSALVLLAAVALGGSASSAKPPKPQLVVTQASADLAAAPCLLTLRGRQFGEGALDLRLGEESLRVLDHGEDWALAELDCAMAPGDYLLEVERGPSTTDRDVLSLTLGAVGPPGPAGPPGADGLDGAPGPQGPPGLFDVEIVTFDVLIPVQRNQTYTYSCPAGKIVLNAGWRSHPTSRIVDGFDIWQSYPISTGTWAFHTGRDPPGGIVGEFAQFTLTCASVN